MIEKGVLHLDQSEFMGMRKWRKDRKKGKEKREEVQFSMGFPMFEQREFNDQEESWIALQEVGVLCSDPRAQPDSVGGSGPKPGDARPKPLIKSIYQIHFINISIFILKSL